MTSPEPARYAAARVSYLTLRRGVGLLSLALPVVLVLGKMWLDGGGIQDSISQYYYTVMRNYFVGSQCATAAFLVAYGYSRLDSYLSTAVATFAVGIALIPTPPGGNLSTGQTVAGLVHLTCATLFFLGMAFFSFFLFTRTEPTGSPTPQKRRRDLVYRACGITIVTALLLVVVTNILLTDQLKRTIHPLFWLETVAVWAIAVAWLVKGGLLLTDSD